MADEVMGSNCPDENVLAEFASGFAQADGLEAHLAECGRCCHVLAAFTEGLDPLTQPAAQAETTGGRFSPEAEGRYELRRQLGSGGQGNVYAAFDTLLEREVALKIPHREGEASFLNEARMTARLDHPGIAPLYEVGIRADGSHYSVHRLVRPARGAAKVRTLRGELLAHSHDGSRLALLPRLKAAAEAVAAAHEAGVVHRDLKPENILLGEHGETVIVDWGLANEIGGAARGGTPGYAPPEQASATEARPTSDVFPLGVMLAEMVIGAAAHARVAQALDAPPDRRLALLGAGLDRSRAPLLGVIEKATRRSPDERYPSAHAFAQEVEAWLVGGLVGAHDYGVGELLKRLVTRRRRELTVALLVTLSAVATAAVMVQSARQARRSLAVSLLGHAEERRAAFDWDQAALLFAQAGEAAPSPEATLGLALTAGHSRRVARQTWPGVGVVLCLAAREGGPLALGSANGQVLVVEPSGTRRLGGAHVRGVRALVFLSDGSLVAGDEGGRLVHWKEGRPTTLLSGGSQINALAHGGGLLAIAFDDGFVEVRDASGAFAIRARVRLSEHPVYGLDVTGDGASIAASSWDGTIFELSAAGQTRQKWSGHGDSVLSVRWSPDETRLASASRDLTVRVWPRQGGGAPRVLVGHRRKVTAVGWLDDQYLVSTGEDGAMRVWDSLEGASVPSAAEALNEDGLALAVVRGRGVYVGGASGSVQRFAFPTEAVATNPVRGTDGIHAFEGGWVTVMDRKAIFHDAELRAASVDGLPPRSVLDAWPTKRGWVELADDEVRVPVGNELRSLLHPQVLRALAVSADERIAAVVPKQRGPVALIDLEQGVVSAELATADEDVFGVALGSTLVLTGSYQRSVTVFSRSTGARLGSLEGHWHGVRAVALSVDERRAASGGYDKVIRLWDLASRSARLLEGHESTVSGLAFSPDGRWLASVAWDGTLALWDVERGVLVGRTLVADERPVALAFGADRVVVAGRRLSQVRLGRFEGDAVSTLEARGTWLDGFSASRSDFGLLVD